MTVSSLGVAAVVLVAVAGAGALVIWQRRIVDEATSTPPQATSSQPTVDETTAEQSAPDDRHVWLLLQEHGGQMRQSAIVEKTGWSKSKVSMVLSDMEADERISKLRLGRQNIISLPGHEPEAAKSPYEK